MTRLLPLVAIVLSLGALAFAAMPRDSEFTPPAPSGPSVDDQARATALEQRITNLESQNRALWERVQTLEAARGGAVAAVPSPVAAIPTATAAPDAVKVAVDQVLADRERERLEARQREMEVRAKDADIRWNAFTSKAQLTTDQMNTLNRNLEAEREARRLVTSGQGDTEAMGRSMRSLREAQRHTDEAMMPMLDEQQRQQYQQVRREERRRPDQRKN